MPLVKAKRTSPGRRFVISVVTPGLHKGEPHAALVGTKTRTGGRNNAGRITTRHHGGGHKQRYRIIDFKRNKLGVPAKVERIEYDPNRSAHIALLLYADGERRYILAPRCARSRLTAWPPLVKSAIPSTACALWARPVPAAGAASARQCAVLS